MSGNNKLICNVCGCEMKYYDKVQRILRTKNRQSEWVFIPRFKCQGCGHIIRNLPNYIYPYKQYETEIISGVLDGTITCETLGFEDYPCEMTMKRWKNTYSNI